MMVNTYKCIFCNSDIYFGAFDAFNTSQLNFKCFKCEKKIIIKEKDFKKIKQIDTLGIDKK